MFICVRVGFGAVGKGNHGRDAVAVFVYVSIREGSKQEPGRSDGRQTIAARDTRSFPAATSWESRRKQRGCIGSAL